MQKKLTLRLALIAAAASFVSLLLILALLFNDALTEKLVSNKTKLDNIVQLFRYNEQRNNDVINTEKTAYISVAKTIGYLLEDSEDTSIYQMLEDYRVDEIVLVDNDGYVSACTELSAVGFDLYSHKQTIPFLELLTLKDRVIVQDRALSAFTHKNMQYIGIGCDDAKNDIGIIIIGISPSRVSFKEAAANIQTNFNDAGFAEDCYIFSVNKLSNVITYHPNPIMLGTVMEDKIGKDGIASLYNQKSIYATVEYNNEIIVVVEPVRNLFSENAGTMSMYCIATVVFYFAMVLVLRRVNQNGILREVGNVSTLLSSIDMENLSDYRPAKSHYSELDGLYNATNDLAELIVDRKTQTQSLIDELEIAKQKSVEASNAKGDFLATISHEIRTPMNGIIGFSTLALGEDFPQDVKNYFSNILSSAIYLFSIINNILDLSKIEANKLELENVPMDLNDILTTCYRNTKNDAQNKGLSLQVYAQQLCEYKVYGDPTRLTQVLMNVVQNSIHYTKSGIVKVTAQKQDESETEVIVRFDIKDSGIGMAPEQVLEILSPSNKKGEKNSHHQKEALGLSITLSLVKMMGGEIDIVSIEEIGTHVRFTIPFTKSDEPTQDMTELENGENPDNLPEYEGYALVCEDNKINQSVIAENLRRVGLECVIAPNGKIGVDTFWAHRGTDKAFKIVFMDWHMPIMDGFDAAKIIRNVDSKVPIVALTANTSSERQVSDDFTYFLGKPFTPEELRGCLKRCIH